MSALDVVGELRRTIDLLDRHREWRGQCLNLIASENSYSRTLLNTLSSDLAQRYANYLGRDRAHRTYRGTRFVEAIEEQADRLARRVFGAEHVELRAISGQVAGAAAVAALTKPGDTVLELTRAAGGHQVAGRMAATPLMTLAVHDLPFDPIRYNVHADRAIEAIERTHPRLVVLGSSYFLFPHPVQEIATAVHRHGGLVLYDASHVLGLIAGNKFQRPLTEGADIVFGSTHKTFPGPQGGIIYTNSEDLINRAAVGVYPALVTNHHVARMPGMAIALAEMEWWGSEYASATIENAKRLALELSHAGIRLVGADYGFTESHTLLLEPDNSRAPLQWTVDLEDASIITTAVPLPDELGGGGIRIGVQELTRRGAEPSDMSAVASVIARVLHGEEPARVAPDARSLAGRFQQMRYSADSVLRREAGD